MRPLVRFAVPLLLPMIALIRPAVGAPASDGPRLVVLVVVDQLTSEHLVRYRPLLRFGLERVLDRGALYTQARFAYAATETGPGHATVVTGAWPDLHGIVGNKWVERSSGAMVRCVEDARYGNSPHYLRAPGIADAMKLASRGGSKVVAVALKPRAAVLLGGQRPDLVTWYDADQGRFVPGRWPGLQTPPSWFKSAVLRTGPERAAGRTWERLRADVAYGDWAEHDDRPFEKDQGGLGRTFPRKLGAVPAEWPSVYPATPPALDDVMTLAEAAVEGEALGADAHPDLLAIGISTFDYVGHWFGPGSHESLDMLLRIDAALGRLQLQLSERYGGGEVLMVVTSDHGVMPMPEAAAAHGADAARLPASLFPEVFGDQVREIHPPRLYLKSSRKPNAVVSTLAARRAAARRLAARPEILEAYVPEDVDRFSQPFRTFYRRMLVDGRTPDILFRYAPYRYVSHIRPDGTGEGTGHGSPYVYDQTVPIALAGPGVRAGTYRQPVLMTQLAPTIAALLGITSPAAAYAPVLSAVEP